MMDKPLDSFMMPITMDGRVNQDVRFMGETDDSEFAEGVPICEHPLCAWRHVGHWHPEYWSSLQ